MTPAERAGFLAHTTTGRFQRMVNEASRIIREALAMGVPSFVTSSWGKDSVVLVHLGQEACPDMPVVHVGDEHEDWIANFSEVAEQYQALHPIAEYHHLTVTIGGKSVTSAINGTDLPQRYPMRFIGLRLAEQGARVYALRRYGAIHQYTSGRQAGMWRVCPLINWSWQDIWGYTVLHELPYLSVYDHPAKGAKAQSRTSSVFSERLFHDHRNHGGVEFGRIAELRATAPNYYNLVVEKNKVLADAS